MKNPSLPVIHLFWCYPLLISSFTSESNLSLVEKKKQPSTSCLWFYFLWLWPTHSLFFVMLLKIEMETHSVSLTTVTRIRADTKFLSCKFLQCKYECVCSSHRLSLKLICSTLNLIEMWGMYSTHTFTWDFITPEMAHTEMKILEDSQ